MGDEAVERRVKLAIVGAGVTGLTCASCLVETYGWSDDDIVILEARKRVGGRVHTTKQGSLDYDEGAAWIHGTENNPMIELLNGREEEIIPIAEGNPWTRPRSILYRKGKISISVDGELVIPEQVEEALQYHFELLNDVSDLGNKLYNDGEGLLTTKWSLKDAFERISPRRTSDRQSKSVQDLAPLFLHLLECWNGANVQDLQLCEFVAEEGEERNNDDHYIPAGDLPGPHCIIKHGMKTILDPLLQNNVPIRLQHEVTHISKKDDGHIVIKCKDEQSVLADACVVTIPAGCLPKVVDSMFGSTALSEHKREAISLLEAGSYKKVFLTFKDIQWPADPPFLGLVWNNTTSPLGRYMIADNMWASQGIPSLEVILFGSTAKWATKKPTKIIQEHVIDFLERALGCSLVPVSCHVTRWEEDPFSQGAYSHTPLGALERHKEELCRPEWSHTLFFAGEATVSEYEGSVHAAILSGRQTAKNIATRAQLQP